MQAVGRVIRTEEDKGVVLLIDERFSQNTYKRLFPEEWSQAASVKDCKDISNKINGFWKKA